MKAVTRFLGVVMASALILANGFVVQAAPQAPTAGSHTAQGGQAAIYLPLINKADTLLNDAVAAIEPAAQSGVFTHPFDATPDPDGHQIFFTAQSAQGAGVFRVPVAGGVVTTIFAGGPFTVPYGLAMGTNGQTVYVADSSTPMTSTHVAATGVNQVKLAPTQGAIFSVAATGGAPHIVAGTERTSPRGLDVIQENGADVIYFLGNNPSDGAPAVMKIPASGGTLTILYQGAPFVNPVGVSILKNSVAWVITDDAASGDGLGSVFRISNTGKIDTLADHVTMGKPAGVALTLDESTALVSTLNANTGTSQVLVINLATGEQGIVNKTIGVNHGSGGLHRAHNGSLMAWCGVTVGSGGTVYRVELK